MPSKMWYLPSISSPLPKLQNVSCQDRRMLGNCSPCQNRRMFRNKNSFSCHVDSVVNQICRFASTMEKKPGRPNLTVACHRHPAELNRFESLCKNQIIIIFISDIRGPVVTITLFKVKMPAIKTRFGSYNCPLIKEMKGLL